MKLDEINPSAISVFRRCIICNGDARGEEHICDECKKILNIIIAKERYGAYKEK